MSKDYTEWYEMINSSLDGFLPPDFPDRVCLCGSARFSEAYRVARMQETLAGRIVLTIGCDLKADEDLFGKMSEETKDRIKAQLDKLHLRKIDMCNQVFVLNVDSYIGESTANEILYAVKYGKVIRFLEDPGTSPLEYALGVLGYGPILAQDEERGK